MPYWKAKASPLMRPSRLWHFMVAAGLSSMLGFFFGYEGLGWSGLVLGGGWVWEASSKFIWKKQGHHSYGDLPDLLAFVLGWTIITIILLLMGVGHENG